MSKDLSAIVRLMLAEAGGFLWFVLVLAFAVAIVAGAAMLGIALDVMWQSWAGLI